jgi:RNA polymerase sigma-70 factor (ECF subfamily)
MSAARVVRLHQGGSSVARALSDEALVAACGVGDRAALGELFDRHHEAVLRFVTRLTGAKEDDVDDVVQDTFMVARSAAARFRGGSAVRTWLLGIAANVVRHAARSRGRRRALVDAIGRVEPEAVRGPDVAVHTTELRAAVAKAIDQLSHDLRTVFVLCDLEELPGAEVASALGIPEGTVYRRRHEARRALRERLRGVR